MALLQQPELRRWWRVKAPSFVYVQKHMDGARQLHGSRRLEGRVGIQRWKLWENWQKLTMGKESSSYTQLFDNIHRKIQGLLLQPLPCPVKADRGVLTNFGGCVQDGQPGWSAFRQMLCHVLSSHFEGSPGHLRELVLPPGTDPRRLKHWEENSPVSWMKRKTKTLLFCLIFQFKKWGRTT